ncbi:hypothetical protein CI088_14265 [Enterococcus plantarum]|uniref:SHOCT domain-containing protein n=1 Tax=Enterococcus plantarum TaxID=1077675 RepID=A0A2W3YT15_9ENTE|nr:SHOCT domain-containing protein [Enterococcus plantarum]PZL71036.1 hypothetical protein CI088_14265 [Enterococcus plantarum]
MVKTCKICEKKIGGLNIFKFTTRDKYTVCFNCVRKAGYSMMVTYADINKLTLEDIKNNKDKIAQKIQVIQEELNDFSPSRDIEGLIEVDMSSGKFRVNGFLTNANIYSINLINGYEIVENGNTVSSGGLGRAAVGAIAFGGAGAIVGAVTGKKTTAAVVESLKIKINLNNLDTPVIYVNLITKATKQSSNNYKSAIRKADTVVATLDILIKQFDKKGSSNSKNESITEEIRNYKQLLDDGIITPAEFEIKKKELLNL